MGHVTAKDSPYQLGSEFFAKRVAELTNGKVKVDVYPASMLGNEDDMVEGLQMGTIDMSISASAWMAGFIPKVEIWGLPFLFRDIEHPTRNSRLFFFWQLGPASPPARSSICALEA